MQRSRCRSCGADVIWTRTAASGGKKPMPVDAEPSEKGNVVLVDADADSPTSVYVDLLNHDEYKDAPKYLSHFATCPDASGWRKK